MEPVETVAQRQAFAGAGLSCVDGIGLVVFRVRKIESFINNVGEEVFHQFQGYAIFFRSNLFVCLFRYSRAYW